MRGETWEACGREVCEAPHALKGGWKACVDSEKPQIHAALAYARHAGEGKVKICMLVLGEVSMRKRGL